jgi:hypothetical protein
MVLELLRFLVAEILDLISVVVFISICSDVQYHQTIKLDELIITSVKFTLWYVSLHVGLRFFQGTFLQFILTCCVFEVISDISQSCQMVLIEL